MSGFRALVDLGPIRDVPRFRRLWIGTATSALGGQLTTFAVAYFVWTTTRNPAMVGGIGLAAGVPLIVFALIGASFTDSVDRRRLVIWTTWGQVVVSASMAAFSLRGSGGVWPIFGLVAIASALSAIGYPARRAFVPGLLAPTQLQAGLALNHLSFQLSMLLGPAAAGVITAAWGTTTCFVIDAVTFVIGLYGVLSLPTPGASTTARPGARAVLEAIRFTARTPSLGGAFLSDLCATVLAMPMALFPVINQQKFGGSPQTLGLLISAVAVGGVTASAVSGIVTRRTRPGVVLLACGAIWGLSLAGVGLVGSLAGVLGLLAVAGAADTWAVVSRGTVVQLATPDEFRGRITALEYVVGAAGPQVGNFRAGLVATASSGTTALITGGLACVAGIAVLSVRIPQLRGFSTVPAEPAGVSGSS